jgi:hypothetical protein
MGFWEGSRLCKNVFHVMILLSLAGGFDEAFC